MFGIPINYFIEEIWRVYKGLFSQPDCFIFFFTTLKRSIKILICVLMNIFSLLYLSPAGLSTKFPAYERVVFTERKSLRVLLSTGYYIPHKLNSCFCFFKWNFQSVLEQIYNIFRMKCFTTWKQRGKKWATKFIQCFWNVLIGLMDEWISTKKKQGNFKSFFLNCLKSSTQKIHTN